MIEWLKYIDNLKKEVSTKLWYSTIGHLATRWARLSFIERKPCASPKIWKTKWKKYKIQKKFEIGPELVRPAHLKA